MNVTYIPATKQPIYVYSKGDFVSETLLKGADFEHVEVTAILGQLAKSTSRHPLFVDVGANVGSICLPVAGTRKYRVVAFEGMPANLILLRNSICQGKLMDMTTLFPFGLSEAEMSCPLLSHVNNTGDGVVVCDANERTKWEASGHQARSVLVMKRMDDMLDEVIDVMKVDVEGWEAYVFKGAQRLLKQRKIKSMVVEVWAYPRDRELLKDLADLGYKMSLTSFEGPWVSHTEVFEAAQQSLVNVYFVL